MLRLSACFEKLINSQSAGRCGDGDIDVLSKSEVVQQWRMVFVAVVSLWRWRVHPDCRCLNYSRLRQVVFVRYMYKADTTCYLCRLSLTYIQAARGFHPVDLRRDRRSPGISAGRRQ